MRFVSFTHSLVSDWNHGNAHFLRGVATSLRASGHHVHILEASNGGSLSNLLSEHGPDAIRAFEAAYPDLRASIYREVDLPRTLHGADVVLVHEWNDPELIAAIGRYRAEHGSFLLFFHDTHHRSVTQSDAMEALDLGNYDGVLAYGEVIRQRYLERGWSRRVWTWHEAADTRVFRPQEASKAGDLVWIGNWGDDERSAELREFLIEPVKALGLRARVYGVRYPQSALDELAEAGIEYAGWLPNFRVPEVFAQYRVTVHVPRRPYAMTLHGIPTIRPFEALACGIPMVSAPWSDAENLFRAGRDFLMARDGREMCAHLQTLLKDEELRRSIAESGRETILQRHTCGHRVQQLLAIVREVREPVAAGQTV